MFQLPTKYLMVHPIQWHWSKEDGWRQQQNQSPNSQNKWITNILVLLWDDCLQAHSQNWQHNISNIIEHTSKWLKLIYAKFLPVVCRSLKKWTIFGCQWPNCEWSLPSNVLLGFLWPGKVWARPLLPRRESVLATLRSDVTTGSMFCLPPFFCADQWALADTHGHFVVSFWYHNLTETFGNGGKFWLQFS